jgi:hypothetical protein
MRSNKSSPILAATKVAKSRVAIVQVPVVWTAEYGIAREPIKNPKAHLLLVKYGSPMPTRSML